MDVPFQAILFKIGEDALEPKYHQQVRQDVTISVIYYLVAN